MSIGAIWIFYVNLTFKRTTKFRVILNPKVVVGGVIGAFVIVIAIIGFSGTSIIDDTSETGLLASSSNSETQIVPLIVQLDDIEILDVDERSAFVEISFKITNPNYKSVLLEMIRYSVYEDGTKIGTKSIGDWGAPGGMVAASNYYRILNDRPTILKDQFEIINDGSIPEIWTALETDTANWRITGDAFYNLSSMTAGGENEISFDFVL